MISCTRKISFDAAHRILNHESKCKYLHGHRYIVEATFTADNGLDKLGRVIDFAIIKEKLGNWIDSNWDHTTILAENDNKLGEQITTITKQKIYYIPTTPTAENLADYLLNNICPQIFNKNNITCIHIKLHETENCYAEATTTIKMEE